MTLYSKCNGALTFQNLCQESKLRSLTGFSFSGVRDVGGAGQGSRGGKDDGDGSVQGSVQVTNVRRIRKGAEESAESLLHRRLMANRGGRRGKGGAGGGGGEGERGANAQHRLVLQRCTFKQVRRSKHALQLPSRSKAAGKSALSSMSSRSTRSTNMTNCVETSRDLSLFPTMIPHARKETLKLQVAVGGLEGRRDGQDDKGGSESKGRDTIMVAASEARERRRGREKGRKREASEDAAGELEQASVTADGGHANRDKKAPSATAVSGGSGGGGGEGEGEGGGEGGGGGPVTPCKKKSTLSVPSFNVNGQGETSSAFAAAVAASSSCCSSNTGVSIAKEVTTTSNSAAPITQARLKLPLAKAVRSHSIVSQKWICEWCDLAFGSAQSLRSHRTHSKEHAKRLAQAVTAGVNGCGGGDESGGGGASLPTFIPAGARDVADKIRGQDMSQDCMKSMQGAPTSNLAPTAASELQGEGQEAHPRRKRCRMRKGARGGKRLTWMQPPAASCLLRSR
jgi:hypothetical protein